MKNAMNKSNDITEENVRRKYHLTKEEREAKKLKLQEERDAKKAARLAKHEAKKQKEAEKRAAAKAKREEWKAKKAARLLKEKERKEAQKLRAKERAEKKASHEMKKTEYKSCNENMIKNPEAKKISTQEKIEAERNEWKALSAIRRYVKDNAKILASLPEEKRAKRIAKLQKMGYIVNVEAGIPREIGYSFSIGIKIATTKPVIEKKMNHKFQKSCVEKTEKSVQPQDLIEPEVLPEDNDEQLMSDEEIIEVAKKDKETSYVEVLVGDTFKDETEIAEDDSLKNFEEDEDSDFDDDEDERDEDDDFFGGISRDQEEYRHEAFREMEANGIWD